MREGERGERKREREIEGRETNRGQTGDRD